MLNTQTLNGIGGYIRDTYNKYLVGNKSPEDISQNIKNGIYNKNDVAQVIKENIESNGKLVLPMTTTTVGIKGEAIPTVDKRSPITKIVLEAVRRGDIVLIDENGKNRTREFMDYMNGYSDTVCGSSAFSGKLSVTFK